MKIKKDFYTKRTPVFENPQSIPLSEASNQSLNLYSRRSNYFIKLINEILIASGVIIGAIMAYQRFKNILNSYTRSIKGKNVLITGGSRGLGLALAEFYAQYGANIIICARDVKELEQAHKKLKSFGTKVMAYPCDLTQLKDIQTFISRVTTRFNTIDILINNAGIIDVGPFDVLNLETFQTSIDINLLGMIRMTHSIIPHMQRGARIINITSIGGAVAFPHLLPYSVSKFGALGFSLGLDAELSPKGISVTTILPGLMRTGSFVHAIFRGNSQKEFDWFALGATLPLISMSAGKAARNIILSGQQRKRFVVLGAQAKLLRYLYQLFPETMLGVMRVINNLLPQVRKETQVTEIKGMNLRKDLPKGGITRLGDNAGDNLNENQVA